jgi:hypothetical protein
LEWIIGQVRDHLEELLTGGGFADVLPGVDARAITDNAESIRTLMTDCVPQGYVRVEGVGLTRTDP